MSCGRCESDPCTCAKPTSSIRSTLRPQPTTGITKIEFGVDLYAALVLISSIRFLQDQYAGHLSQGRTALLPQMLAHRDRLKRELMPVMDALSDADAAEIVRRYPWVMQ